jgi:hypothetical protein
VPTTRLINKLSSFVSLADADRAMLAALRGTIIELKPGEDVAIQGDRPHTATLVLTGILGRYKLLSNGRRQFLSFDIPGDMPDLQSLYLETLDCSLGALTESINRTLRELRVSGLIGLSRGILTIRDWHRLCEISGFDANYLHQVA